jgi:hypothetical protein
VDLGVGHPGRKVVRHDLAEVAGARTGATADRRTLDEVSIAESPDETSHLTVVTPKEALRRALPLPTDDGMVVEGLTDAEWDAFEHALADRSRRRRRGGRHDGGVRPAQHQS